jgi:hypothetical protein
MFAVLHHHKSLLPSDIPRPGPALLTQDYLSRKGLGWMFGGGAKKKAGGKKKGGKKKKKK